VFNSMPNNEEDLDKQIIEGLRQSPPEVQQEVELYMKLLIISRSPWRRAVVNTVINFLVALSILTRLFSRGEQRG